MYLMGSTRCGISAKQIQRETGVTYKCAWRIFHQIRKLMSEEELRLGGTGGGGVEADEAYFGGRRKNDSGRMLTGNKGHLTTVIGVVERKGRIVARVQPVSIAATSALVKEYLMPETMIFTDEGSAYNALPRLEGMGYEHKRINHSAKVYVAGEVHTNTIEGFLSLVKRGIGGVYHSVSAKYLQTYLNEYSFRYNRRDSGNLIFAALLERASETLSRKPSLQA